MTEDDHADLRRFHNRLRILLNIDEDELNRSGATYGDADWIAFSTNPWRWLILADDLQKQAVYTIIRSREPDPPPKPIEECPPAPGTYAAAKVCETCHGDVMCLPPDKTVCPTCGYDFIPF